MTDMLWDSEPSTSVRLASSAKRAKGGRTRDPLGVGRSWLLRWAGRAAKLSEGIDGRIQRPQWPQWGQDDASRAMETDQRVGPSSIPSRSSLAAPTRGLALQGLHRPSASEAAEGGGRM